MDKHLRIVKALEEINQECQIATFILTDDFYKDLPETSLQERFKIRLINMQSEIEKILLLL
ncbi:MAG TPA: hypothetical protein VF610_00185 [Segetibacter sp.]